MTRGMFTAGLPAWFCLLVIALVSMPAVRADESMMVEEIEFRDASLLDIIRVLSEDSGINIVATPEASKKQVTIYLKQVTVEQAIIAIARANGLWYRRDSQTGTMRLMTVEEYSKDLVVNRDDEIRVFQLRNPNVFIVASAIENLYPDRVELEHGEDPFDEMSSQSSGGSGSGNGRNGNSRSGRGSYGGRSGRSGGRSGYNSGGYGNRGGMGSGGFQSRNQLPGELTVDQLEAISSPDQGLTQLGMAGLQKISSTQDTIYVTTVREHNLLLVRTSDTHVLREIGKLVKSMDQPAQQVMLEMRLVEVQLGDDFRSIFNFNLSDAVLDQDSVGLGNNALQNGSFVYEYVGSTLQANIEFLEQENRIKVVASPMVVASNHRDTRLFIGEERLIVRGYSIDVIDTESTSRTVTTPETELVDIGTTLQITPHINPDRTVTLEIDQESSTLNPASAVIPVTDGEGNVVDLPVDTTDNSRIEGTVVAKHAYTVAVGGLIRENRSQNNRRVPWLADLPVVGRAFDSYSQAYEKSELVLMITPRIITQPENTVEVSDQNPYYKYAPNATVSLDDQGGEMIQVAVPCREACLP